MRFKKLIIVLVLILSFFLGCSKSQKPNPTKAFTESLPEQVPSVSFSSSTGDLQQPNANVSSIVPLEPDYSKPLWRPLNSIKFIEHEQALFSLNRPLGSLQGLDRQIVDCNFCLNSSPTPYTESIILQQLYGNNSSVFAVTQSNEVYLTFNLDYEAGYTASILDTLKEKGVKAVFFISLNYADSRPDLVDRMIADGHILGNYSPVHAVVENTTTEPLQIASDALTLHGFVSENYNYEMELFRPKEGVFSNQSLKVVESIGYKSLFWNLDYTTWESSDSEFTCEYVLSNIVESATPGAIYRLNGELSSTATVLSFSIDQIRAKGYKFSDCQNMS